MTAHYVEVSFDEFDGIMTAAGFSLVRLPGVHEMTYQRDVTRENRAGAGLTPLSVLGLAVRVYSSIPQLDGRSRPVGADAIRVQVVHPASDRLVWSATRTHRTQGWREKTIARMREAWREALHVPACPECRTRPMVRRHVKDGSGRQFFSCVGWPGACKGTRPAEAVKST